MSGMKATTPRDDPADPGATRAPCVICGRPSVERYRTFCSKRCADADLGRWLSGSYAVPTDERPDEDAGAL